MISFIFFIGDNDEAIPDHLNLKVLRREYNLGAALALAAEIAEKENELVRVYEDDNENIRERFVISAPQAAERQMTSGALLLEVLKEQYERTHRMLEQEALDDFDMLEALHSEGYWQEEREDIRAQLTKLLPHYAKVVLRHWQKEFDDEYDEARGEKDDAD